MAAKTILDHTRKRLWTRAGNACAFPGCGASLLEPTPDQTEDTVVGVECHIVAQRDDPSVARSLSSLTEKEREQHATLIEDRHSYANLVLICRRHERVIDDPAQKYSVAAVIDMKVAHEGAISREQGEARARRADPSDPTKSLPSPVRLRLLEDVPSWQRKAVKRLAEADPDDVSWLEDEIGELAAPDIERLVDLVGAWPPRLEQGSVDLHYALARLAEGSARWSAASEVWERLATRDEHDRADHFVRAAIDASVAGDDTGHERLLASAEHADPDNPRLRLERLDDRLSPEEQLDALEEIHSDNAALAALIASHRARAAMLLPDLESAEKHLEEAEALDADTLQARTMRVNLEVQRARLALTNDQPFDLSDLERAREEALELRETMTEMGRWEESARLLMLAADVPALMRDPDGAKRILNQARPQEVDAPEAAEVLGDAALRSGAPDLALKFAEGRGDAPALQRIRASARLDRPGPSKDALETLRELALDGGPEAEIAAFARLSACLPPSRAPWDEEVASVLRDGPTDRQVCSLHAFSLAVAGEVQEAERVADELPNEPWAAEVRLRVATERGKHSKIIDAAEAFLAFSPDGSGRLAAAFGLARAGRLDRAGEVMMGVAHDLSVPPRVRSDAFAGLMRTLADRDAWDQAEREWDDWQTLSNTRLDSPDGRVSAWQVRISHRRGRQRRLAGS